MEMLANRLGLGALDGDQLLIMVMIFGAVFLAVVAVSALAADRSAVRRRLGGGSAGAAADEDGETVRFLDDMTNVGRFLRPITKRFVPTDLAQVSAVRRRLVQAGYLQPSAVGLYYTIRVVLAAALPLVLLIVSPLISGDLGVGRLLLLGAVFGLLGSYLPIFWIGVRTRSLQRQYMEGFPDALDLLVVCVEAGLALDSAIGRVGEELGGAHRKLSENFKLMALELRAGKSRQDALRNLAERLGIEEVRSMVTLLLQSEELGTSIADALRVYSDEMRVRRMLRAEAKAMALPVKLALPLGFFIFPTIMIVILLPAFIRIKNTLFAL